VIRFLRLNCFGRLKTQRCEGGIVRSHHSAIGSTFLKCLWFSLFPLCSFYSLSAAPDPDLFDGRVAQQQDSDSSTSSASSGAAAENPDTGSTASSRADTGRDFSEIGQVGGGQSVSVPEANDGRPQGAVSGLASGGSGGAASNHTDGSGAGGANPESGSASASPAGTGASTSAEPRDFDSIGSIGSSASNQTVEVNSSKASTSSGSTGTNAGSGAASSTSQSNPSSSSGGSGSQTSSGRGSGDYGDTLPSGI